MEDTIRVAIADDHAGVRQGLQSILKTADAIEVVGEAGDGAEAIELVQRQLPDILLLDVEMPVKRGDEVARFISENELAVKVLVISSYSDRQFVEGMLQAGASGYIMKDDAPTILIDAVRGIFNGDYDWVGIPVKDESEPGFPPSRATLSRRELDVLRAYASGKSNEAIARQMGMSPTVLKSYFQHLEKKFRVSNRNDLLKAAKRGGIIP